MYNGNVSSTLSLSVGTMDRTMDLSTLETGTPDASFEKLGRQVENQGWPTFSLIHKLVALRQLEA